MKLLKTWESKSQPPALSSTSTKNQAPFPAGSSKRTKRNPPPGLLPSKTPLPRLLRNPNEYNHLLRTLMSSKFLSRYQLKQPPVLPASFIGITILWGPAINCCFDCAIIFLKNRELLKRGSLSEEFRGRERQDCQIPRFWIYITFFLTGSDELMFYFKVIGLARVLDSLIVLLLFWMGGEIW